MDYKYIEQLLERYWDCQTSLEEEQILRSFFSQKNIPVQLQQYKALFELEAEMAEAELGEKFDERMLAMTEQPKTVKVRRLTFKQRIMPLCKAAAVVAVIVTVGSAMETALNEGQEDFPAGNVLAGGTYVRADKVDSMYSVVEDKVKAETTTAVDSVIAFPTNDKETAPLKRKENFFD